MALGVKGLISHISFTHQKGLAIITVRYYYSVGLAYYKLVAGMVRETMHNTDIVTVVVSSILL